jgi:hypothetical protein
MSDRNWPAAESDSKPGKLLATIFAEFASDRFAALCWASAIDQKQAKPPPSQSLHLMLRDAKQTAKYGRLHDQPRHSKLTKKNITGYTALSDYLCLCA